MNNPYLTIEEIKEAFRKVYLEETHNFIEEDLSKLANAFVMAAMPAIVRTERAMCVDFVRTLNPDVAKALSDKRGNL
jgi:hypothetical protein